MTKLRIAFGFLAEKAHLGEIGEPPKSSVVSANLSQSRIHLEIQRGYGGGQFQAKLLQILSVVPQVLHILFVIQDIGDDGVGGRRAV